MIKTTLFIMLTQMSLKIRNLKIILKDLNWKQQSRLLKSQIQTSKASTRQEQTKMPLEVSTKFRSRDKEPLSRTLITSFK